MKLVIGITGASGSLYARGLCQHLKSQAHVQGVSIVLSRTASEVWGLECGGSPRDMDLPTFEGRDYNAPFASGSAAYDGMVVVPASMSTVARVAHGISDDLLTRAADVMLKERKPLILVPRETPYSTLHLQNMLTLSKLGATIIPASPSFYGGARTVDGLIDTVLSRVLDHLGLPNNLVKRWGDAEVTGA